jgi:corrinoid protein of di/trimethylamine methyltransferase
VSTIDTNLEKLSKSVMDGDIDTVKFLVKESLKNGVNPLEIVDKGLAKGIRTVGERYGKGEIFLTELLMGAEAMKVGMAIINPEIKRQKKELKKVGSIIIGTVAGDIHDLGKNIVAALFSAHGFDVADLGVDVPDQKFIDGVKEMKPDILGLSALMTSTIPKQRELINLLKLSGLRDKVKVMIGGAAVNEDYARDIGADGYAENANDAVVKAKTLVVSP